MTGVFRHIATSLATFSNGFTPVENSKSTHPKAHISHLKLSLPSNCSGDMYLGVPCPAFLVAFVLSRWFETPKSINLTFS